jgi:hypothetical protein
VGAEDNRHGAGPPEKLTRLDPASGAVVAEHDLPPARGLPERVTPSLVALGGGAVWALGRTGRLQRIDERSGARREVPGIRPDKIAAGDGQVWALADIDLDG